MPTYQYVCTECATQLEVVQTFTDPALTECPTCGGRLRKVFSAVGVVFKGSGFYRNDSREKVTAGAKASGDGKTDTKNETKSETKNDGKNEGKNEGKNDGIAGSKKAGNGQDVSRPSGSGSTDASAGKSGSSTGSAGSSGSGTSARTSKSSISSTD